jgi:hypothetical protein
MCQKSVRANQINTKKAPKRDEISKKWDEIFTIAIFVRAKYSMGGVK